eukprot:gene5386-6719_t
MALHKLHIKYGSIYSMYFGSVFTVVLNGAETINEAFVKHPETFVNRYMTESVEIVGKNKGIIFANGEHWKKVKNIVNNSLTKSKIRNLDPLINQELDRLIVGINKELEKSEDNIVNLCPLMKRYTFNVMFYFLFSKFIPFDNDILSNELKEFLGKVDLILKLILENVSDFIPFLKPIYNQKKEIERLINELNNFTKPFVLEQLKTLDIDNPRNLTDILLIEIKKDPKLTIDDFYIERICLDIIIAGSDTIGSGSCWILLFLCNYQDVQEELYQELSTNYKILGREPSISDKNRYPLVNAIIKESARRSPTAPFGVPHECTETVEICGYTIPKGAQVLPNIYSSGLSPYLFDDPWTFNPKRYVDNPTSDFSTL